MEPFEQMEGLEERIQALENWMANTRRIDDPTILQLDRHIWAHKQDWQAIKELREEVSTLEAKLSALMVGVSEIRASLIALYSASEVHNLIEELKE